MVWTVWLGSQCLRRRKFRFRRRSVASLLADLTVSKRPGTSYHIEIHFDVVNHLYLLFSLVNLVET